MRDRTLRISVIRPYRNVEELLVAEAWAISERTVILVGAAPHPEGASLEFDLALSDGRVLMRGHGAVIKYCQAHGTRPSGLAIRVGEMDEEGMELVQRVEMVRAEGGASNPPRWSLTPSLPPASNGSAAVEEGAAKAASLRAVDPWGSARQVPLARSASVVPAARRGPSMPPTSSTSPVAAPPVPPLPQSSVAHPTVPPATSPPPPASASSLTPPSETSHPPSAPPPSAPPPSSQRNPADWERLQALQRLRERRR